MKEKMIPLYWKILFCNPSSMEELQSATAFAIRVIAAWYKSSRSLS
jgi:hypothetical protein